MHTWYRAVCDQCKEMCDIVVTFNSKIVTDTYLKENEDLIMAFLSKHYGHSLKMTHDNGDGYLDKILQDGYLDVEKLAEEPKKQYIERHN